MRVTERMKKWISMILCLCMLAQNAPMMVFAASTDNLCEHHPKHTEDCGYVEAVAGSACTHKHSEACYEIVECKHTCSDECGDPCTTHTCTVDDGCITRSKDCHHVHGECGYAEAVEPQDCTTCQPVLVHAQNCGYVESADEVTCACEPTVIHGGEGCTYVEGKDGSPCTHVCAVVVDSDDSCYKLLCSHKDGGHDDTCGYAAAVEGHACNYECSACEDNAGDDSPVPEGVCAHGNSEENCETCVGEIQVMINALPDMEDIGDHNRADVISQLEAIDDRMWKLSDAAKGKLNADKYVDAAFVLSAPEGFFGFLLTKRYEAGASAMPQASFAFLDASGVAATVITPEEQQTTSVEPVSNGGAVRGYLPVGEYTLDETVVGDWNLTMSVNGQADDDHTFTGEGGRAYGIETVNTYKPCDHTFDSTTGKCSACGQACSHEGHTQDGCTKCNVANPHTYTYQEHVCACGLVETGWYCITLARDVSGYENFDTIAVNHAVAQAGTTVEVKVEIKTGYRFEKMTVTGADKSKIPVTVVAKNMANDKAVVTFVMPAQDVKIDFADAAPHADGVDVTVVQTGEGTVILPEKTDRVPEDGWIFTVTPAQGYELMSLTLTSDVPVPDVSELTQIPFEKQENGEYRIPRVGDAGDAVRSDMILTVVFCNHSDVEITPNADGTTHTVKCNTCGKSDSIAHTATTKATCTEKAVCDICHESFGEVDPDAHALTDGECTRCGARKIFFEANVSWNEVYAYYWNDEKPPLVTWPGVELTKNNEDGMYHLVVPKDAAEIIFNDGKDDGKNKTGDLELGVENCYHYDGNNSYWYTYPCTEHTWGKDGMCSNCRTVCPHKNFNYNTGECSDCKTNIAVAKVEIGGTTPTYFKTLANAVNAAEAGTAEAPATLTLLKNIALGENDQQIGSGVFTLDLNGCTLAGSGSRVLNISGTETHVTITDGSEAGAITNTSTSTASYCNGVRVTSGGIVTITGGTISASDYGVYAISGAVTITGGTITGVEDGVYADESTVTISGGTITGTNYGVYAYNSSVEISGGKITGTGKDSDGVYASSNSTVTIEEGTITGTNSGVHAYNSSVEISGGKITGTGEYSRGVYATSDSAVTITGGEISGTGLRSNGVYAYSNSTVTISGGTVSGNGYGVNAMNSTVKISRGTITGTYYGVYAYSNSNVTINGGTVSGESGVKVSDGTANISGGTITGVNFGVDITGTATISGGTITSTSTENNIYAAVVTSGTVTITGGTITGEANDLRVDGRVSSITLTLAEGATEGATFPGGLTVYNTTLVDILAKGAAYWQNGKMIFLSDGQTEISDGDVTVKAVCKHTDVTYPDEHITDTHHTLVCSCGYVVATESHTRTYTASGNVIKYSCSQCKATFGTATITANGKTYNGEPVTAAVQKTGVLTDSIIGITYSQNGEELNESAIRAGTYTASIKLGDAVAKVNFTITPATLPNAVLSETGYTYNGQQQKPDVTVNDLKENTDYTVTYPQDVTNAGEKTVTITGKGNYTGTVTKSYTIAKADSVVTKAPQAAANLVYNGKNQNLVIAGTVTGGTLRYSLDGKTWTATIPVGKAAGTYTVSYKVVGDGNHKDIAVRTLAVTIAKGTAPAVDALVQTHFYAYATANTVDLAKYLPADRGTTAYTAIGVSADIFSSVLTVTNAGVLSYTTRKLTAAPASDTQIRIRVVMENYADAELTVTVKLLAVTAQTQQKIVKTELTEVPAGLAGTRFHSVDAIKTEQTRVLGSLLGYDPQGNILHYDVKLQFSPDGGKTWVDATEENFPANGLTVTLPYPSGTGKDTHNFVVSHMFTTGAKAGTTETPAVTKTADGIRFTVTGLSPVSVACSAIPFDVKVANVTNGTVYVSSAQATAGTQVTITATPKSGYRLSSLAVKDAAGNSYTVSTDNNGKYYFIMPAADVTVTATFTAKSTAVADTTNPKTGDDFPILFWSGMMMTTLLGAAALMLNKQKFYER